MEELKNKLLQAVNEAQLPLEAVYYVVKDLYRDVNDTYTRYLDSKKPKEEDTKEE